MSSIKSGKDENLLLEAVRTQRGCNRTGAGYSRMRVMSGANADTDPHMRKERGSLPITAGPSHLTTRGTYSFHTAH